MSLRAHEFVKFMYEHDVVKTPSGKVSFRKRKKVPYVDVTTRMPYRLKLMHEFMRYVHDFGYLELLHERLAEKDKRRGVA